MKEMKHLKVIVEQEQVHLLVLMEEGEGEVLMETKKLLMTMEY